MNSTIKLLLVEDHKLMRVGLKSLFEEQDGLEVTSEANSGKDAIEKLLIQCSPLFIQQTENLTSYQMNFLRAVCSGITDGFGKQSVSEDFGLGSKSNISRLIKSLTNKELIDRDKNGIIISDPVFRIWFKRLWTTGNKIG